jgi:hypothetical protein
MTRAAIKQTPTPDTNPTDRNKPTASGNDVLLTAAIALRDDLLMRGKREPDGTIIVNASAGRWMRFNEAIDTALSITPTMSAEDMREAAAKVAAEHKPKRVQQGKTLKGYDPEDREIIRSEENGEYVAASIIATAIRSLPLTKEPSQ